MKPSQSKIGGSSFFTTFNSAQSAAVLLLLASLATGWAEPGNDKYFY